MGGAHVPARQQRLYFLPLPQGQGSFLPAFWRAFESMVASLEQFRFPVGVCKSRTLRLLQADQEKRSIEGQGHRPRAKNLSKRRVQEGPVEVAQPVGLPLIRKKPEWMGHGGFVTGWKWAIPSSWTGSKSGLWRSGLSD